MPSAPPQVTWTDFVSVIQAEGYTGKTDDLETVRAWLVSKKFDPNAMHLGDDAEVRIDDLWKQRPGRKLDASGALESARRRQERQDDLSETLKALGLDKQVDKARVDHSQSISVREGVEDDPNLGYPKFDSLGFAEYLYDVRKATRLSRQGAIAQMEQACPRLVKSQKIMIDRLTKAGLGMNEAVDSEGAFLAMPEHSDNLLRRTYETAVVMPRARQVQMTKPQFTTPYIVETSRIDGSRHGGVRAYRVAEGSAHTVSQPALGRLTLTAKKLSALSYVTEELEEDSDPGSLQLLAELFSEELGFVQDTEIIRGNGASQMLGILNSACLVSAGGGAAFARTTAGTVEATDLIAMWARMYAKSRPNSVWFINQDVESVLPRLFIEDGAATAAWGHLVYMPPGGLSAAPYGTLFGRPVIPIEQCSTIGTVGDVILADMTQYLHGTRRGITSSQSIHVQFLTDQIAFKVTLRDDGQPWWQSALTPFLGTSTQSPFLAIPT